MEHPIQGMMRTAMESLKTMVDVGTVIGDPVETQEGTVIIPVSRVSFGFAAGGGEYGAKKRAGGAGGGGNSEFDGGYDDRQGGGKGGDGGEGGSTGGNGGSDGAGAGGQHPFGGGSGAGVSVQPVGFLVCGKDGVRMLHVEGGRVMDKLVDMMPDLIERAKDLLGSGRGGRGGSGEQDAKLVGQQLDRGNQQLGAGGAGGQGQGGGNGQGGGRSDRGGQDKGGGQSERGGGYRV